MTYRILAAALLLATAACSGLPNPEVRAIPLPSAAPQTPFEAAYEEGKRHLAADRMGLAIVMFDKALAINAHSVIALNACGSVYDRLHRYEIARAYYDRALRIEPNNPDTWNNMAVSMMLARDFEMAKRYLAKASSLDANNEIIRNNFRLLADMTPVRPKAADYVSGQIGLESGGRPDQKNRLSSATGAAQFIDATWLRLMNTYQPELIQGKSRAAILAMRNDPALSAEMTAIYGNENASFFARYGVAATTVNISLAHHFGAGGAVAIIRRAEQNPDAPIEAVVGPAVMRANPELAGQTVGQVRRQLARRWAERGKLPIASSWDANALRPIIERTGSDEFTLIINPRHRFGVSQSDNS
jgi:tetratricopeptide (TPR) repeat protein